jgi:preprotein translocase subunit SecE
MSDLVKISIWVVVIGGLFAWMWRAGHLARLTEYVKATREELRKCTWPSWDELKGSTVVVFISIGLLGGFTIAVDYVFMQIVLLIT